ncbi:FtsX-like permease family protein [Actinomadura citrea]|uniref:Putative ABC transport system permease protein n=1 Tax=Actinomadura citrea TaxID=46158 RepID=A0A7Y9G857_9ACTN|nr:FtsX family ABC transporter permease [Actinomadura citrea]NYE11611.1 putative ABC transport system permease protein [Actinomadura citrea]GGT87064.1 ABC transporter substrate-binding protein [Actinomadura citrea]
MWLIARRSFAESWTRLAATLLAAVFSIGLIAGALQFTLRAQEAVSGSDASEYSRADVLVQGGSADPDDPYSPPDGRVALGAVAGRPGVAAVAGDATVPVTASGSDGKPILPPAGAGTALRPWTADGRLNPYRLESGRAPAADGEVAVTRHVARAGGLDVGDTLKVLLPRQGRDMKIVGVVTVQGHSAVASGDLVLAPSGTVAQAAGLPAGTWQSVWVKASGGSVSGLRAALARDLGKGVTVRTAAEVRHAQSADLQGAGASIGGAIGMLSSVAVFVGLFVVANTFGTLVRQRTRRLALLSAIGATPRQIKRLIRFEALVLGVVASAGGVALGFPISALLTHLFAKDGFDISAADAQYGWVALAAPAAAGVLVTQLAARRAARRAAKISPMQALRTASTETAGRRWPRVLGALAVFACAWLFFGGVFGIRSEEPPGPERTAGTSAMVLLGCMTTVAALAVLAPFFVGPLGGLVGRIGTAVSGEAGRLARATITRSPRRVSSAASSLMLGVALVASTAMIVLSVDARFNETGREVMRADHAITTTGMTSNGQAPLPRDAAGKAAAVPGVSAAAALTMSQVKLVSPPPRRPSPEEDPEPVYLTVTGADQRAMPSVLKLGGHLPHLGDGQVALTSTVMKGQKIKKGQRIVVRGARGRVALTVAAAYHDPSHLFADQALVSDATMDRLDPTAAAQVVLVRGGTERALSRAFADAPGLRVVDGADYVKAASDAMTKGMSVIYGFILMALVLALFGMATTVSMSVGERTREFGLLGAVGATAAQIRSIVRWEAATVVLLGSLLGLGTALGTVTLLHIATGSSFLVPNAPWWLFATVITGAAAVTLATSALPARRAVSLASPLAEGPGSPRPKATLRPSAR